jgi:cytochrome c biogenesis protein CcdA
MIQNFVNSFQKKSLKERFLLVMGILFLMSYLTLGILFIFMKPFPFPMQYNYRVAFGVLLIVYAMIRFSRIINDSKN